MADRIAGAFGTMGMFWGLVIWQLGWITLATAGAPLFKSDPYPFVFCLFLSNLIQLWALPILGTATNRADAKREVKAEIDHQALTYLAQQLDGLRADVKAMQVPEAGRPTQNEVR
jgi:uncharacterized membrane protein